MKINELINNIHFPIKDFRCSEDHSSNNVLYYDTKIPDEMYECLKRNILTSYLREYFIEQCGSGIEIKNSKKYKEPIEFTIYYKLFDDTNYGVFKPTCLHMLDSQILFDYYSLVFFKKSNDYWKYYEEVKITEEFKELAEFILDKLNN